MPGHSRSKNASARLWPGMTNLSPLVITGLDPVIHLLRED